MDIMKWSEFALSQAKSRGKNQYCLFDMESYIDFQNQRDLLKCFHQAVNNQMAGFEVYYQPVIDMETH